MFVYASVGYPSGRRTFHSDDSQSACLRVLDGGWRDCPFGRNAYCRWYTGTVFRHCVNGNDAQRQREAGISDYSRDTLWGVSGKGWVVVLVGVGKV